MNNPISLMSDLPQAPWPKVPPRNILVRMPNWLGDLVMATPVLADLRARFPDASLTAMCQGATGALLTYDPHINEIFSFQRPSGWIHRRRHLELIGPLRKGDYDLGILLTHSFSSAWWLWRGRVKNRLGFDANYRFLLLNKAVPFPKEMKHQHLVLTYKQLLAPLGIPVSQTPPCLYLHPNERSEARELLARYDIRPEQHQIIGINPGAAYGSAKCWLPERFVQVTQRLLERPEIRILYFGDPAGAPLVDRICQHFPRRVLNLAGKTSLRQLMALISLCHTFLTNDSGPMHIAAALGTPLLALFGSTSAVRTGPSPKGRILHKHVSCSPCYKRVCPIDFRCMKSIEPDEVYRQLLEILEESGQDPSP